MRTFEIARKMENGEPVSYEQDRCLAGTYEPAFPSAQLPVYKTKHSAGADFFCAEEVVIPSIWKQVFAHITAPITGGFLHLSKDVDIKASAVKPTLVHTGIKANMADNEVLKLYNRSSNPGKLGLILANGVGVIDADYYNNPDNDGEIMFAFYNFMPYDITIKVGDTLGQGVFEQFFYPEVGLKIADTDRKSGFGSTDDKE